MYRRILIPLDGSELAEVALNYAKEVAGRLDIDLVLLYVCNPNDPAAVSMHRVCRGYIQLMADIAGHRSQEVQQETSTQPGAKAVEARGDVTVGHPADEILRYTDENDIDLILMATHGRSGIRRWSMGSVADKVLRSSKVPVWLVRAGIPEEIVHDKRPNRTMLVPLDGSELAEAVLPHVEALAKQRGSELVDVVLLRVCEVAPIPDYYPSATPMNWGDHVNKCQRAAEEYLATVEKQLTDTGLRVNSKVLVAMPDEGNPADFIVDYTDQNPCNLIVMSTHGRTGLSRWAFGSIADRVLRGVSSPIFLVRPH